MPPTVQSLKPVAGECGQCEIQAQQYAVTNFLLAIFSQKVRSAGLKAQQLTVPTIKMVHLPDREPCLQGIMQPLELDEGEIIDFTTKSPHDKEREVAQFLESFMHWSHNRTNGELMLIVDKVGHLSFSIFCKVAIGWISLLQFKHHHLTAFVQSSSHFGCTSALMPRARGWPCSLLSS